MSNLSDRGGPLGFGVLGGDDDLAKEFRELEKDTRRFRQATLESTDALDNSQRHLSDMFDRLNRIRASLEDEGDLPPDVQTRFNQLNDRAVRARNHARQIQNNLRGLHATWSKLRSRARKLEDAIRES